MSEYWLDLFTPGTWKDAAKYRHELTGFRQRRMSTATRVKPGDIFLCYLTGAQRWVGALRVTSNVFEDDSRMWAADVFPVRFRVEPLVVLEPETGVPAAKLAAQLPMVLSRRWEGIRRGSPVRLSPEDGSIILQELQSASSKPRVIPLTKREKARVGTRERKLRRTTAVREGATELTPHQHIQRLLLELGSHMNLQLWVARSDKGHLYEGTRFGEIPGAREELGLPFTRQSLNLIENIDVLWLRGTTIVAAFEIEHSTNVYGGILRMADLVALNPNISIRLYVVAPDERRSEVLQALQRPTFNRLDPPLRDVCRYIPYTKLEEAYQHILPIAQDVNPTVINSWAESIAQAP
jgi:hypothetical protein